MKNKGNIKVFNVANRYLDRKNGDVV